MGLLLMPRHRRPPVIVEIKKNRDPERSQSIFEQVAAQTGTAGNKLQVYEPNDQMADAFRRAATEKLKKEQERMEDRERRRLERLAATRARTDNSAKRTEEEHPMDMATMEAAPPAADDKARLPDWNDLANGKVKAGEKYIAPNGAVLVAGDPLPPELVSGQLVPVTAEQIAEADTMAERAKARRATPRGQRAQSVPAAAPPPRGKHFKTLEVETAARLEVGLPALDRMMTPDEKEEYRLVRQRVYNKRYKDEIAAGLRPAPRSFKGVVAGKSSGTKRPPRGPAKGRLAIAPAAALEQREWAPDPRQDVQPFEEWSKPQPVGIEVDGIRYLPTYEIEDVPLPPPADMVVWPFVAMRKGQSFKVPVDHRGAAAIRKEIEKMAQKLAPGVVFETLLEPGHVRCVRRS